MAGLHVRIHLRWTERLLGHSPFVAKTKDALHVVLYHTMLAQTNVVEGDANFLMGLDLQRFLKINLGVVDHVCHKRDKQGIRRPMQVAQAAGSGLLCLRVDRFDDAADSDYRWNAKNTFPATPTHTGLEP